MITLTCRLVAQAFDDLPFTFDFNTKNLLSFDQVNKPHSVIVPDRDYVTQAQEATDTPLSPLEHFDCGPEVKLCNTVFPSQAPVMTRFRSSDATTEKPL